MVHKYTNQYSQRTKGWTKVPTDFPERSGGTKLVEKEPGQSLEPGPGAPGFNPGQVDPNQVDPGFSLGVGIDPDQVDPGFSIDAGIDPNQIDPGMSLGPPAGVMPPGTAPPPGQEEPMGQEEPRDTGELERNYSPDAWKEYESDMIAKWGVNPYSMDVDKEVRKIMDQELPGYFDRIFRGKFRYDQRHKMTDHARQWWERAYKKLYVDVVQSVQSRRNAMLGELKQHYQHFERGRAEAARQTTARRANYEKLTKAREEIATLSFAISHLAKLKENPSHVIPPSVFKSVKIIGMYQDSLQDSHFVDQLLEAVRRQKENISDYYGMPFDPQLTESERVAKEDRENEAVFQRAEEWYQKNIEGKEEQGAPEPESAQRSGQTFAGFLNKFLNKDYGVVDKQPSASKAKEIAQRSVPGGSEMKEQERSSKTWETPTKKPEKEPIDMGGKE